MIIKTVADVFREEASQASQRVLRIFQLDAGNQAFGQPERFVLYRIQRLRKERMGFLLDARLATTDKRT